MVYEKLHQDSPILTPQQAALMCIEADNQVAERYPSEAIIILAKEAIIQHVSTDDLITQTRNDLNQLNIHH